MSDDAPLTEQRIDLCDIAPFALPSGKLAGRVIFVDAAADMTRYHVCIVSDIRDGWWVMCENLSTPIALPLLPYLPGWHPSYIQSKIPDHNPRTALALCWILDFVHRELNAWNQEFAKHFP